MGYEIRYEKFEALPCRKTRRGGRFASLVGAFLLAFLLLTQAFWPAGTEKLRELLLPGDPEVTAQAAATLVSGLRAGESLTDAAVTFCREILDHGKAAH